MILGDLNGSGAFACNHGAGGGSSEEEEEKYGPYPIDEVSVSGKRPNYSAYERAAQLGYNPILGNRDGLHLTLEAGGLIPGLGEPFDLLNGAMYSAEGDRVNAAFSYGSAIPIVGYGFNAAKWGRRAVTGFQKHHVIPKAVYREFRTSFETMGFLRDAGSNIKRLPTPFHGNHPGYSDRVREGIQGLIDKGNFNLNGVQKLQHELRQEINDIYLNGGFNRLNDYYKGIGY